MIKKETDIDGYYFLVTEGMKKKENKHKIIKTLTCDIHRYELMFLIENNQNF